MIYGGLRYWSPSGQAFIFNKSKDRALSVVLLNSEKKNFHSSEEKFMHKYRIYEKLVKILIEVKRFILNRISEFPVNMHNFRPI